jgi:RNA polymerase sigma factor (sigma-70 family)
MSDPKRIDFDSIPGANPIDRRFRRPLMSFFLRRVGDHAEAEDLTQQVFLRLLGSEGVKEPEHAEGFVFTVATNLLRDRARKAGRRGTVSISAPDPELVADLASEAVEDRSPERVLLGRESLAEVLRALDELGERTRDMFILFRLENMKQRDIAALYGIGVSTVEKHIMKATLHLAKRYGTPQQT